MRQVTWLWEGGGVCSHGCHATSGFIIQLVQVEVPHITSTLPLIWLILCRSLF
jgi:hypothetical protein